ncbi:unnamed protein product [Coffea canephora]|uniref:Uncharacterized protein n=1 Tax=Coffea canephora TaxID=49390 RepID=A0A068UTC0_COFCA|nr:unnamed protein product [Coffea canephora]
MQGIEVEGWSAFEHRAESEKISVYLVLLQHQILLLLLLLLQTLLLLLLLQNSLPPLVPMILSSFLALAEEYVY